MAPNCTVSGLSVFLGGVYQNVLYAGVTPGYVGLYQMNVQLAPSTPSGVQELVMQSFSCDLWPPGPLVSTYQVNTVNVPVE